MNKYHALILILFLIHVLNSGNTQCTPETMVLHEGSAAIIPSYTLSKPAGITGSTIGYCPAYYNTEFGASYILLFEDEGGSGMDGYPCIKAGGAQYNNEWHPGDFEITGMPIKLGDINPEMEFKLITSQENALDTNDKWMASVNFIFDIYGTETSKPVTEERDFDIVVKAQSHNFNGDILSDQPIPINNRFWFFARNEDGSLKTYDINIDGTIYSYAVRYKFFDGAGAKDNKAHVKFIPVGPSGTPPVMKIKIKEIISVSKEYIAHAALPEEIRLLAENKIAAPETWLKAINAGYEVYKGESILIIDQFKVYPGVLSSDQGYTPNQTMEVVSWPNPAGDILQWSTKENPQADILNLAGRSTSVSIQGKLADLSEIAPGIYLLSLKFKNGKRVIKKFIKR